jgi:hypothetical protein
MLANKRIVMIIAVMIGTLGQFSPFPAHAWPQISDETIRGAWGAPGGTWNIYPRSPYYAGFCIGDSKDSDGGCKKKMGSYSDDEALLGIVARKITEHGGYFCTTQFQCEGKNKSYTFNLEPAQGRWCQWLCADGYSGEGCAPISNLSEYNLNADNPACGTETITMEGFDNVKLKTSGGTSGNIEHQIDLFHSRYNDKREEDVLVGISGWLANKRGVIASPFLFYCSNKANANTMDINVYTSLKQRNMCLPGFTGPNCEKCRAVKMCNGFVLSGFDPARHIMTYNETDKCSKFKCLDGTGFVSATDQKCTDCSSSNQYGVNNYGVCIKCSGKNVFDTTSKECKSLEDMVASGNKLAVTKEHLKFGLGNKTDISDACWAKAEPMEYRCCVLNKTWNLETKTCS